MSALAGALLDQLAQALQSPSGAGSGSETLSVAVGEHWADTINALRGQLWVDGQVRGAWLYSQPLARQVGKDLEQLAADQDWMWRHLTTTILPHSQAHLVGYVFSHGIVPLRVALRRSQSNIRFLMGWRGQIDTWKKRTVTPQLLAWMNFNRWFTQNARHPVTMLIGWVNHPDTFAQWAVPWITRPLVNYLAGRASQATVDQLTALIVDHTPDVWRHVEAAALALLATEV